MPICLVSSMIVIIVWKWIYFHFLFVIFYSVALFVELFPVCTQILHSWRHLIECMYVENLVNNSLSVALRWTIFELYSCQCSLLQQNFTHSLFWYSLKSGSFTVISWILKQSGWFVVNSWIPMKSCWLKCLPAAFIINLLDCHNAITLL